MQLFTDWGANWPVIGWRSTTASPYYLRTCTGCADYTGVEGIDFTTLNPDRTLCSGCLDE